MDDPLSGPRALVCGCLGGLLIYAVTIIAALAIVRADTPPQTYLAAPVTFTLPRHVYCAPQYASLCAQAVADWSTIRPGLFQLTSDPAAEVQVVSTSGRTWVQMPLSGPDSTVYLGADVDIAYWLPHELGHTLNLRDHIWTDMDPAGYVNPAWVTDGYRGVMSYAASHDQWFGPDDVHMLSVVFPLPYRVVVAW